MTTKKTTSKATSSDSEKQKKTVQAKMLNSASLMSAAASESFSKIMFPDLDLSEIIEDLKLRVAKVQSGDMAAMEAMLVGQAQALQTIFVGLTRKAVSQEYLKNYSVMMSLALKAQSQSRATIQALTELKYPKQVAFVKQANISHGHQQINNDGTQSSMQGIGNSRAEKNQNQPNELLEVNNGSETMDTRATQTTIPNDQAMATLEKQYRGKNS